MASGAACLARAGRRRIGRKRSCLSASEGDLPGRQETAIARQQGNLLSKMTASTVVLLVGTAVAIFGVLLPIFHVPVRGSLSLFFGCTVIFVFAMCGLGMTVASLCRNR